MYARVLRKWSLKTKRMYIKRWLTVVVVVTMLLLIICAPVTAAAAAIAAGATLTANVAAAGAPGATNVDYNYNKMLLQQPTSTTINYHTRQLQPHVTAVEIPATAAAKSSATFKSLYIKSAAPATAIETKIPPNVGNVIEESFYIPVASQEDEEGDSYINKNRAAIRNWQDVANNNRLINKFSSRSGSSSNNNNKTNDKNNNYNIDNSNSSSSSRSSNSKIINSISRLSSSNNRQQQQQQQQQQEQIKGNEEEQQSTQQHSATAYTDSLVYSYYYKAPISAPVLDRINPQQQHMNVANENDNDEDDNVQPDDEEEDDDDDVEGDDDIDVEEELEEQTEYENEIENTAVEKDIPTVKVTAEKVPNVKNSQIINIINNAYEYTKQKEEQQIQQQQIYANSNAKQQQQQEHSIVATVPIYVRSIKARRHIQEHEQQHQQSSATSQNYHSPVREMIASPTSYSSSAIHSASALAPASSSFSLTTTAKKLSNITATQLENTTVLPYRYLIKSLVLTPPLENIANLTQEQRQKLWDEHEKRRLKMQNQPPRSRRDSRAFGQMQNVAGGSTQQQFFGTQQQQFQRLQQQQPTNLNNNNINKQQQQQQSPQQQQYNHNSHQHNHHHHHHQQQQQRQHLHQHQQHQHQRQQRKHPRRYCSARDPAQLAFEAPTVFEGKIISMTPNRRANFSATVEVKDTFKHQFGYRLQKYVRLQFAYRNSSGECDIYREQLRPRGLVRGDQLEQGRVYLMFVQQIDLGNFTILGQPIRKTRRVVEAIKNAVSENYAQLASIRSLTANNRVVESGQELRIICRVQGSPPPKVTWFKNDKSINRNRKLYQFVHYKKRSELIIRSFNSSDAGRYECRAKNKVNRNLEHRTIVISAYKVPRYDTSLTGGTGNNCPDDASEFCFNGGTCQFFPQIGSYSCICVEGFTGERCDSKEANNIPPNSTFKSGYIADDPNTH